MKKNKKLRVKWSRYVGGVIEKDFTVTHIFCNDPPELGNLLYFLSSEAIIKFLFIVKTRVFI